MVMVIVVCYSLVVWFLICFFNSLSHVNAHDSVYTLQSNRDLTMVNVEIELL